MPVAAALGLRSRRALGAVVCVNLVTNPALNLAAIAVADLAGGGVRASSWWLPALLVAELVVTVVEWLLLRWALGGGARLAATVVLMNAASFTVGLAIWGV